MKKLKLAPPKSIFFERAPPKVNCL